VSDKRPKKDSVEVSSQSLQDELVAIKDRLSAIETIASISNTAVVKKYVEDQLKTDQGRAIMKECAEPRTKTHLISQFGFNNRQALDHHLKPLVKDDLPAERFAVRAGERKVSRSGAGSDLRAGSAPLAPACADAAGACAGCEGPGDRAGPAGRSTRAKRRGPTTPR
jgi:hypothetical protein